ncbi:hypothetical protein SUGI_0326520 [Cryptomeria japonica]|uniref:glucan endo-1,3-beta-glucosidase-like n=1 Tax=Cryptomeria japonica TaxID=3369 RepID=UPI002408EA21|nr:glucan endo-1,3-beta-glucosidase-like [Cryptomeria japonica]GLJ18427.1 hypothetical protein SUGI_0326520 [Cryptomeria japonica]
MGVSINSVSFADGERIGVNNGLMGDNLPSQDEVVALLQEYSIGKYRIFKQEPTVFKAFKNSGIEIVVGVANSDLQNMSSSKSAAMEWVDEYIKPYYPATNIKYIVVGNEVLGVPTADSYVEYLLPAMKNIQEALTNASLENKIKVSTALAMDVIGNSISPNNVSPSKVTFINAVKDQMTSVLQFLEDNGSPFLANVFPYKSYLDNSSAGLDFALFSSSAPIVRDGDLIYRNLFDAMVDAFYSGMEGMGYPNIPIVVSARGWPSKGNGEVTTIQNTQNYINNLIRHVLSNAGMPKRPGKSIETYIFSVFNEDSKTNGEVEEKNYGLFYPDKQPVYSVDFSPSFSKIVTMLFYIEIDEYN